MQGKIKEKGIFRISVYFNEQKVQELVKDAEKMGFRRLGIPFKRQKPNGFANEWLANTDGIGRFLKHCWQYYKENEAERAALGAKLLFQEKELQEQKKKLGMV